MQMIVGNAGLIFIDEFCRIEGEDDDDVDNYEDESVAGSHVDIERHDFIKSVDL